MSCLGWSYLLALRVTVTVTVSVSFALCLVPRHGVGKVDGADCPIIKDKEKVRARLLRSF